MAKGILTFDADRCKGCDLCVSACPMNILELNSRQVNKKGYTSVTCIAPEKCTACGSCAVICPDSIIKVERDNG